MKVNLKSISTIGEVKLEFNQYLKPLSTFNLTVQNISNSFFFDVAFKKNSEPPEDADGKRRLSEPPLKRWFVQNFTDTFMIIKLVFANPLQVTSNAMSPDQVSIAIKQPLIFQSKDSGMVL